MPSRCVCGVARRGLAGGFWDGARALHGGRVSALEAGHPMRVAGTDAVTFLAVPGLVIAWALVAICAPTTVAVHPLVTVALIIVSRLRCFMASLHKYLAEIGRRGGIRSRRVLEPDAARRMVAIREARRAARRVHHGTPASRHDGTPADTTTRAQAVQDALQRRLSPAEKLAQV